MTYQLRSISTTNFAYKILEPTAWLESYPCPRFNPASKIQNYWSLPIKSIIKYKEKEENN